MTLPDIFFIGVAGITVLGAILAVGLRNVFYNALSLILCLFGVAGIFIFLSSEFLAVIEVTVYIGAISVAIIFAIMLSRPMTQKTDTQDWGSTFKGALIAAAVFAGLVTLFRGSLFPEASIEGDYSMKGIGRALLSAQALPFEVISLVLLISIIGALVISQSKDRSV